MTDHTSTASSHLLLAAECAVDHGSGAVDQMAFLATAQVHATLALVEATNTASLITMLPRLSDEVTFDRFDFDRPLPTDRDTALATIRERLGLS